MTSVNLEKVHEYLKVQESLRSENHTKYYLRKETVLKAFLYPEGYYTYTR